MQNEQNLLFSPKYNEIKEAKRLCLKQKCT